MWIEYYVLASGVGGTTGPDMIARHSPPLLGRAVAGDCGLVNISERAEGWHPGSFLPKVRKIDGLGGLSEICLPVCNLLPRLQI